MNQVSAQNLEDAANLATEFIYSLENLPFEVRYLLEEIRIKDIRTQELQHQIDSDSARYIKNGLDTPSTTPSDPLTPKNMNILPARIAECYGKIAYLANEKCRLAEQLITIIARTRSRLDVDLTKVRALQGEESLVRAPFTPSMQTPAGNYHTRADPASHLSDSVRNAISAAPAGPSTSVAASPVPITTSVSAGPLTKKRRLAAASGASVKLPMGNKRSESPIPAPTHKVAQTGRSRLSRQVQKTVADEDEEEDDAEADAEEQPDDKLYCFCQQESYGDMIACDNEGNCPYEWFHLPCLGMKQPLPETWYCSHCLDTLPGGGRKSRKK